MHLKKNPDIVIKWVRDSTGIITAKLLAEKNNPHADVVWGVAGSSMVLLKNEGILKAYRPQNLEALDNALNDPQNNQAWFGNDVFFNAICFNDIVAKQYNLPKPTSWDDLTKPIYKGHIAMPSPASSGTGYMQVSAWLQNLGKDKAWDYMQKLDKNIAHYTHSGSKPCVQAGMGEIAIGISMASRGVKLQAQGAPISIIILNGIGWEAEAVGLVKKTEAAKRVVDWSISKKANELYLKTHPVVAYKGLIGKDTYTVDIKKSMVNLDVIRMGADRLSILKIWSEKFDSKSESKS